MDERQNLGDTTMTSMERPSTEPRAAALRAWLRERLEHGYYTGGVRIIFAVYDNGVPVAFTWTENERPYGPEGGEWPPPGICAVTIPGLFQTYVATLAQAAKFFPSEVHDVLDGETGDQFKRLLAALAFLNPEWLGRLLEHGPAQAKAIETTGPLSTSPFAWHRGGASGQGVYQGEDLVGNASGYRSADEIVMAHNRVVVVQRNQIVALETKIAAVEGEVEALTTVGEAAGVEIERLQTRLDRLAEDALFALAGAGIPTPEKGYKGNMAGWLRHDIEALAKQRDEARDEVKLLMKGGG